MKLPINFTLIGIVMMMVVLVSMQFTLNKILVELKKISRQLKERP